MPERALVIIDIQNDYFPGGAMELEGADAAAANASKALARARREGVPVFHVRHVSTRPGATFFIPGTKGAEIHAAVRPQSAERVIEKNFPNSFRGTELERALKDAGVQVVDVVRVDPDDTDPADVQSMARDIARAPAPAFVYAGASLPAATALLTAIQDRKSVV